MNEIHATFFVYRKNGGYGRPHQYAFVLKEQNNPDSKTLQAYILNAGSCELTKFEALDDPTRGQEFGFEPDRNYNPIVLSRVVSKSAAALAASKAVNLMANPFRTSKKKRMRIVRSCTLAPASMSRQRRPDAACRGYSARPLSTRPPHRENKPCLMN